MVQKLRQRMGREEGFTLVELLVVMLILGLLAAIAIPSFFNQRDKAKDADAKAAARTAQTAMETFATDNGGKYAPTPAAADLVAIEATLSDATLAAPISTDTTYTVGVESETGTTFNISRNGSGQTNQLCTDPGKAGCPSGDGNWGN